ncbi:MAG: PIN domain-containing protein [Acidimicrobiales bacterium]
MRGVTLDAGALLAVERRDARMTALLALVRDDAEAVINVPAGAVAQAWRDGRQQALLARLLAASQTEVVDLDGAAARAAGVLLARAGTSDVVDASVALCATERRQAIVTSDAGDIRVLAPSATIYSI